MRLKYDHQCDKNITFNYQWDCRKREQVGLFQFLPGRRGIPRCQKSLHHSFYFNVYFVSSFRFSKVLKAFTWFLSDNKHFNQQAIKRSTSISITFTIWSKHSMFWRICQFDTLIRFYVPGKVPRLTDFPIRSGNLVGLYLVRLYLARLW